MSIAVSAVVGPSRRLRALVAAYGLANLAAALVVGVFGADGFAGARLGGLFFLCAGACLLRCASGLTKTRRIDISGVGTLRLTVQQDMRTRDADRVRNGAAARAGQAAGEPAELLEGSTVWPRLILLRLRTQSGAVVLLPVLCDSVAPGVFRALAVAIAAIGGRNKPLQRKHQIL